MEEDRKEEMAISGGHENNVQTHRPDDGEAISVKPPPLGACIADDVKPGDR